MERHKTFVRIIMVLEGYRALCDHLSSRSYDMKKAVKEERLGDRCGAFGTRPHLCSLLGKLTAVFISLLLFRIFQG